MRLFVTASLLLLVAAPAHAQIAAAVVPSALALNELGNGVFAVVAVNLGETPGPSVPAPPLGTAPCGFFEVQATGARAVLVCHLSESGACADQARAKLYTFIGQGGVGVYGVLVFGPTEERIMVTFTQGARLSTEFPGACPFVGRPFELVYGPERAAVSIRVARQ